MIDGVFEPRELDDDEKERVFAICDDMVDILDDHEAQSEEALQALTAVIVSVICNHYPTRNQAMKTVAIVVGSLSASLQKAEDAGQAAWIRNRAN